MKRVLFAVALIVASVSAHAQMFGGFGGIFGGGQQQREYESGRYGNNNALRGSTETVEVEVVHVRMVKIKPQASMGRMAAGSAIGGAVGAAAGQAVGDGTGRVIATTLGGVLGAVAGNMIAEPSEVDAQEVTIRRVGGQKLVTVVQAGSTLQAGQRALAADIGGELRVFATGELPRAPASALSGL